MSDVYIAMMLSPFLPLSPFLRVSSPKAFRGSISAPAHPQDCSGIGHGRGVISRDGQGLDSKTPGMTLREMRP